MIYCKHDDTVLDLHRLICRHLTRSIMSQMTLDDLQMSNRGRRRDSAAGTEEVGETRSLTASQHRDDS